MIRAGGFQAKSRDWVTYGELETPRNKYKLGSWRKTVLLSAFLILTLLSIGGWAQAQVRETRASEIRNLCARDSAGSTVLEPRDLRSGNGTLKLNFTIHSSTDSNWHWFDSIPIASSWPGTGSSGSTSYDLIFGHVRYCYTDEQGNQTPTLRVNPGDELIIRLKNDISLPTPETSSSSSAVGTRKSRAIADPCAGGPMTSASTNLHFHGLSLPPVCHGDDNIKTVVQPGDPPFEYRVRIPKNQPPGLYWYHPHVHGSLRSNCSAGPQAL